MPMLLEVSLPAQLSRARALEVQLLVAVLMMLLGRPGKEQIQRIKIRMKTKRINKFRFLYNLESTVNNENQHNLDDND